MTSTWLDESVIESSDSLGGDYGEADFAIGGEFGESYSGDPLEQAESDDAESARSRRARATQKATRRATLRQNRQQAARQRRAPSGSAQAPTTSAAVRNAQAGVREVKLANKVQDDMFGAALAAQRKRIYGTQLALAGTVVERQLESSFPSVVENRLVAVGLRTLPLGLLGLGKRGSGLSGYLTSPSVLGIGAVGVLTAVGELTRKSQEVNDVRITRSERELPVDSSIRFRADAFDASGRVINEKRQSISWTSGDESDEKIATVDPRSGLVTAKKPGNVTIKATGERSDLFDQALVTVVKPASG